MASTTADLDMLAARSDAVMSATTRALEHLLTAVEATNNALTLANNALELSASRVPLSPNAFRMLSAVLITDNEIIWTPTAGKRFRLMGGIISITGASANILLTDGIGGSTIFVLPVMTQATPFTFNLGDGILSSAVDNVLAVVSNALCVINGTIWGREE